MSDSSTTLDGLLDRRVQLEQPATGYRVAVDTVLLGAAVSAFPEDIILDLGCGVGGAMLCVACRIPGIAGLGLELNPDLVEICQRNIERNLFAKNLKARQADVTALPPELHNLFTQVLMNPPYHEEERHDISPHKIKGTANTEKQGDFARWIASAHQALKPGGTLTLVHRADRKDDLLKILRPAFGDIRILLILPKEGGSPKRLILRARKGAPFSVDESRSLVLHSESGAYTLAAEDILRRCQPITDFD